MHVLTKTSLNTKALITVPSILSVVWDAFSGQGGVTVSVCVHAYWFKLLKAASFYTLCVERESFSTTCYII